MICDKQMLPSVFVKDGSVYANSRDVAAYFEKRHADVLRAIDDLECSPSFTERNFAFSGYLDSTGRKLRSFDMTKDGLTFLVMGFRGAEAARFKEAYIEAFNAMEEKLRSPQVERPSIPDAREMDFVRLARQVKGERFASALWNRLGFYAPPEFDYPIQHNLFQSANQNIAISISAA